MHSYQQTKSQCRKTAREWLTWYCQRTRLVGVEDVVLVRSASEAQAVPALHKQKLFPSVLILAKACMGRGTVFLVR